MAGYNELIFLAHMIIAGGILLAAARQGRTWIVGLIIVCTLLMNIAVMKQMTLFGLTVTGGNVLYATVFLGNDVLNEHFGRQAARRAVMIAFAASLAALVLMQCVLGYAPNEYDHADAHLHYFFNVLAFPRIVIVSLISYATAQLLDVQIYHALKRWTGPDRALWFRSNASTWVSQAYDTVFFTTAALVGTVITSWAEWRDAVLFAYLIKILAAALHTPFLYLTTWHPLIPAGSTRPPATSKT